MDTKELLTAFYQGFARHDAEAMAACYADDVRFSDEVFPELKGEQARNMWRMLCERAADLKVVHEVRAATPTSGQVHWEAWYTFSATGKKVHNVIDGTFELRDGKIVRHTDAFDFYRWSRQALGATGLLLGWTPLVKNKVRAQAGKGLEQYSAGRKG